MLEVSPEAAIAVIRASTKGGRLGAAGVDSRGRPTPKSFTIDQAELIVHRAKSVEWVAGDSDGLRIHVHTPGGRRYRLAANDGVLTTGLPAAPADTADPNREVPTHSRGGRRGGKPARGSD